MTAREYLNTKMYWTQDDIPIKKVTPEDIIEWLEGYAEVVKNNAVLPLVSNMFAEYCDYCEETTQHRIIHACQKCCKYL